MTDTPPESSTKIDAIDFDDPLYLHPSDHSITTIISFKLLGTENFRVWKSSMTRALKARNKQGFIEGTELKDKTDTTKSLKWDRVNAIVCSWILNSLSESIYIGHACSEFALDVWNELCETYYKADGSVVFNVHQQINSLTQGTLSVSDYFNKLDGLWKEFDGLTKCPDCTCEAATSSKNHSKLMKLMQFLSGLDDSYNQVKSHILIMEPLPDVRTAFSIISREESNQKHGNVSILSNKNQHSSAFAGKFSDNKKFKGRNQNLICKNCGIKGHTIEKFYKLIGYPKDFKPKSEFNKSSTVSTVSPHISDSANVSAVSSDKSDHHFLTNDQYTKLMSLLYEKELSEGVPVNANMAGMFCNNVFFNKEKWIIDSGASQHMTASESHLSDLVDVSKLNLRVDHPNGSTAKIDKIGNINMSNSIGLSDVFVIPEFHVSLLSVHKICKENKCKVIFDENNCFIQDSL